MSQNDFLFDKRIIQRNVAAGFVDQKTVDKTLSSLPDRESNVLIATIADDDTATSDDDDEE